MNKLVVFSSETGNTEKLANTVADTLVTNYEISHINLAPDPSNYDILFIGYKLNRGSIDPELIEYLEMLTNKRIFLFGTMGVTPDSPYGRLVKKGIQNLFEKHNNIIGHYLCQGRISEDIMQKWIEIAKVDPSDIHAVKQVENYDKSLSHPDGNDLSALRDAVVQCLNSL